MALKGAAWLLQDAERLAAWRTMIDADLLVSAEQFELMPSLLSELGYVPDRRPRRFFGTRRFQAHFHLVPHRRGDDPFMIEVHRHLGWRPRILPTEMMFANQLRIAQGLSVPAPWCAALHAIVHWQIQHDVFHKGESRSSGNVKNGLEVARFLAREDIDWPSLAVYAKGVGIQNEFEAGVGLATELFGVELPREVVASGIGSDRLVFCLAARSSPARRRMLLQKARIAALWRCDRAMYRVHLRTKNPILLSASLWGHRMIHLPIITILWAGVAITSLRIGQD
jgi:hypothetical protein